MTLDKLVERVKRGIQLAQAAQASSGARLEVQEVQLEVQTELLRSAGLGFSLEVIGGLGLKAGASETRGQTLSLTLVPDPRFFPTRLEPLPELEQELTQAVSSLRHALQAALSSAPAYRATRIAVTLHFGLTESGEIALIFSASSTQRGMHKVTVVFEQVGG